MPGGAERIHERKLGSVLLAAWLLLSPGSARAATPLQTVELSPDITVVLDGVTVNDENVAHDSRAGVTTLVDLGSLPGSVDVHDHHLLPGGERLFTVDTTVALPAGITAAPGDVVRYNGATYAVEFDASAAGLPDGVMTDAVTVAGNGDLLLSFDTSVVAGGLRINDEDLVRFDGATFTLFFDGSIAGVAADLDLDAAHYLTSNGHLLLSFDGSGTAGGVDFEDEDVLEYNPATGTWEMAYDGSVEQPNLSVADLDAVDAEPLLPTGTPTVSPTLTPTATRTHTRTATPAATSTATATERATATHTPTASGTETPTRTATTTHSRTITATQTPEPSLTATRSATRTFTATATASPSSTSTATATATVSQTQTLTRGPTDTPSPTATIIPTTTPTPTGSPSQPTVTPTATAITPCVGDCNGDGEVTVDELLTMVNIALENPLVSECPAGDGNADGEITIDEILTAVNNALSGCAVAG